MSTGPPPLLQMLAELIGEPSMSSVNPAYDTGNLGVVHRLAGWLRDLGFEVEILPLAAYPSKANLVARLGSGEDGLVLAGHTDTVPYDEGRWQHDPFRLSEGDGRLYGLGTSDMKAFLALVVEAARGYRAGDLARPLTVVATADEESSMHGARELVDRGRPLGRWCVIGEPTGLAPVRQHKGIMMEAIRLVGRSGHSSDPALGNSALEGMIEAMGEILALRARLAERHRDPAFAVPVPTLNLGHIHGGDNPNRICGECELQIDLRPLPGMAIESLREQIRAAVAPVAERRDLGLEVRPLFEGIPAMQTAADSAIVRAAESLTGKPAGAVAFGTEGPYFNELGMDTVVLGPGDIDQAHQPDEYLRADRIRPTIEMLGSLIRRFCVEGR